MSVYAFGNGKANGELGTGSNEEKLDPVLLESIGGVIDIKTCEATSLALTSYGDLFAWGRNREGQCGIGTTDKLVAVPTQVTALVDERVVATAVGSNHCLAVTANGALYQWGKLHRLQDESKEYFGGVVRMVGLDSNMTERKRRMLDRSHNEYYANKEEVVGETENDSNLKFGNFESFLARSPLRVDIPGKVVKVAGGYGFSVAVTEDGDVFAWGFNDKLQLGLGHRFNQESPQRVKALQNERVVNVACGQQHTLVLTSTGQIWAWGLGVFGQLGLNSLKDGRYPKLVNNWTLDNQPIIVNVEQIACGSHHSVCLDSEGRVWSWGSSEYGQQGGAKTYEDWGDGRDKQQNYYYSVPRHVPGFEKPVIKIACGTLHNLAITQEGQVYTWGWGITGALGHGNKRFQLSPSQIYSLRGESFISVSGGTKCSFAVTAKDDSSFAFAFKSWVNNEVYSDLSIEAGKKSFYAHRVIVFARCPRLRAMYHMTNRFVWQNKAYGVLRLPYDPALVLGVLHYLYTDHLKIAPHWALRLSDLARRLGLPRLEHLAVQFAKLDANSAQEAQLRELAPGIAESTWVRDMSEAVNAPEFSDLLISLKLEGSPSTTPPTQPLSAPTEDMAPNHIPLQIPAHRLLLHARSDFFHMLFTAPFAESGKKQIAIVGDGFFLDLLHFMYTNSLPELTEDNIVQLLHGADRYLLLDMKNRIEKTLICDALVEENVVDLLQIAESASALRLKGACLSFLTQHLTPSMVDRLKGLRGVHSPLLRELDFFLTKQTLISAGDLFK